MTDDDGAAPQPDPGDEHLRVGAAKASAAGLPGVIAGTRMAVAEMGVRRGARALLRVNQADGFDCPGCAWPESAPRGDDGARGRGEPVRSHAEFCENGMKAVAEEATTRRVGADFFAAHPIRELAARSDHWLGSRGRLTEPMVKRPGSDHYEPVGWDEALGLVADELRRLDHPDRAVFYTSGRTSNEAAFLYQLLVRRLGTNNLPDCSNLCHESSGVALTETLGVGKGSVTLDDLAHTDLVLVVGQNPGTNHPRMLTALERAKENGARVVAVNPLPEAGLLRFKNPQRATGVLGRGTELADLFLQIRVNGDLALFQALNRGLLDRAATDPSAIDRPFLDEHCDGFDELAAHLAALDWDDIDRATGLSRSEIDAALDLVLAADRIIVCWAMGLTQHRNSVPTIREIVNFCLLRGNVGRPGAGVCPVRGHSNVQGDRTMGIHERPRAALLDALEAEFGFAPPRDAGYDVVDAIRAMRDGRVDVFFGLGGNFVAAAPDTEVTSEAMTRCRLTAHVSTKLNRSHTVCGDTAVILPCLGRTERDVQASGEQYVTVEDSMGMVHASRGRLEPASPHLRSEVAIVAGLAAATFGPAGGTAPDGGGPDLDWAAFADDYGSIRDRIEAVVPGFDRFNERSAAPAGFALPHPVRDSRTFPTATGRARLTVNHLDVLDVPDGHLLLQTIRSHDQFNTTIYGLDDRYRGIHQGRRVVFAHADDLAALGVADGRLVDLVGAPDHPGGAARRAPRFRVVAYPVARGTCAAYFPEANVLVPLDSTAEGSNTPTSKSVIVRLEPASDDPPSAGGGV
ncbi:MAG: FdhF/YdeP family oxidoreductase [Acidimicrobiales bacterium]|nr:FdhF/YdeP family oxidoreductase [Acidimicrobiales bacterium]MCB9372400.1 FdhF/YdeP family oxidoreductase [Microthrixaceae bacterium]